MSTGTLVYLIMIAMAEILWVSLCVLLAKRQKRDTTLAFVAGLLFGLLAVIAYIISGFIKVKK